MPFHLLIEKSIHKKAISQPIATVFYMFCINLWKIVYKSDMTLI